MQFNKNKEMMLAIGIFSLAIAILLDIFAGTGTIIDFLSGMFTGLSLTMNLAYLIKFRLELNSNLKKKIK